jgi:peptidoglycan/xylan/chitin deacetylase (PgdA/CDA1 family)
VKKRADIAPGSMNDNPSLLPLPREHEVDLDSPMDGIGPSLPYPVKAAVTRVRSALWLIRSHGHANESGLRILFYHRISADRDELAVHPRRFREQMDYLAGAGYRVVDIVQVADLLDAGEAPKRTVGLNFDDGYLDVAEHALPVLAEHGFRATVFIATGVTDGRASFAWYRHQPPLLDWAEIAELDRGGTLEFEAHSVTHPSLLAVDDRRAAAEIEDSKRELEDRLHRPVTALSYPAGLFGQRERRLAVAAGYRVAVSCEPGVNLPHTDRFALRRRQIDARDRLIDFRAKVGGGHDTPLPLRGVYRQLRYGEGRGRPRLASTRR